MGSITIVSGAPGTGKTTVGRELAKRAPRGVHIESDGFYFFITDLIAPSEPESREQNITVITAVARAAAAYAAGGYDVVVDGVFGRWFLPLLARESHAAEVPVDFIVLRAPLEETLDRVADRGQPGIEDVVLKLHGELDNVDGLERHAVNTYRRALDGVVGEILQRRPAGDFRLELSAFA